MFKLESKAKIGAYIADLIDKKYETRTDFCRAYLNVSGAILSEENIAYMKNRLSQIIHTKRKNFIQIRDLPIFSELLGVTCEQILSAGDCTVPVSDRVTNYSIASSKDPAEWEKYINREDKLILNNDEYCKTALDYALEFGNYKFLKYLMDNKYIWFESKNGHEFPSANFGAGTSIERRKIGYIDTALECKLKYEDELRLNLIALAADNDDIEMLDRLRARENPLLYDSLYYRLNTLPDFKGCYNERMVKHIVSSSEKVLDYFTDPFEIQDNFKFKKGTDKGIFMFPYISNLLDFLISENSAFAKKR